METMTSSLTSTMLVMQSVTRRWHKLRQWSVLASVVSSLLAEQAMGRWVMGHMGLLAEQREPASLTTINGDFIVQRYIRDTIFMKNWRSDHFWPLIWAELWKMLYMAILKSPSKYFTRSGSRCRLRPKVNHCSLSRLIAYNISCRILMKIPLVVLTWSC